MKNEVTQEKNEVANFLELLTFALEEEDADGLRLTVQADYVEGTLNIHICGAEVISNTANYMFVTQTADATALEVTFNEYGIFFTISNQLHHSCGL